MAWRRVSPASQRPAQTASQLVPRVVESDSTLAELRLERQPPRQPTPLEVLALVRQARQPEPPAALRPSC